jgi:signal transduction histidine kinase
MKKDKGRSVKAAELRHRAEEQLKAKAPEAGFPRTDDEQLRLLHELQVHQIELEMQNAELRQARDELETALENYTELYDYAPVSYFALDRDGAVRAANLTGVYLLRIKRYRLLGRRFQQFVADETRPAFAAFLGKVFMSPAKVSCEVALTIEGNSPLFVMIEAVTFGSGQECRAVLIDITERRQMEQELCWHRDHNEKLARQRTAELQEKGSELGKSHKALMNIVEDLNLKTGELEQANLKLKEIDRLKSMFIASMSHELRTPLNSIIGFSSILHDEWAGKVNAEQKENLAIIRNSGLHLLNLINDVIDVSKIEAGKIEAFAEEFDLAEMITEAVKLVKREIEAKGLALQLELINLQMHTDRRRLLQCVLNLLSNAMKFTERGSVTIRTRALDEGLVEISVTDTGIGIRPDELDKLFQPFVRLVSPIRTMVPGTGLGLYLSRKLAVGILKGDIFPTSEFGKGSCFILRIPVRLP